MHPLSINSYRIQIYNYKVCYEAALRVASSILLTVQGALYALDMLNLGYNRQHGQ